MRSRSLVLLCALIGGCAPGADSPSDPGDTAALTAPAPGCAAARDVSSGRYEFQDDVCQRKVWPSQRDRDFACPIRADVIPVAFSPFEPLSAIQIDTELLADLPPTLDVTAIRILRDAAGVPHYRYYSNGSQDRAFQPYSSTKFMAIANAATWLRGQSNGAVGLPASVGGVPLGDLVTIVHSYNAQHYDSNALAAFFQYLGGPLRADALIHAWLGRSEQESFGGRYGEAPPALGGTFVMPDGSSVTTASHDLAAPDNNLSTLTMAEFLRRLVLHREEPAGSLPGLMWDDARVLFYGAETPHWFPIPAESGVAGPKDGGGMSADAAIYLQQAVDIAAVEKKAQGQWRIFSKLGFGGDGFVANGYACFPELDANGQALYDRGVELVISTHVEVPNGTTAAATDGLIAAYYKEIVARLSR